MTDTVVHDDEVFDPTPGKAVLDQAKQIVIQKKPKLKKTKRKGKKSIAWARDVEILTRLALVADLLLEGKMLFQISKQLECSLATTKRDVLRVKQLWREESKGEIADVRNIALAQYKLVITRAWDRLDKAGPKDRPDRYLAVIAATQKEIDRIQGIGPTKIDLSGSLEITEDIEKVRERRWNAIKPQFAEMLKQKNAKPVKP